MFNLFSVVFIVIENNVLFLEEVIRPVISEMKFLAISCSNEIDLHFSLSKFVFNIFPTNKFYWKNSNEMNRFTVTFNKCELWIQLTQVKSAPTIPFYFGQTPFPCHFFYRDMIRQVRKFWNFTVFKCWTVWISRIQKREKLKFKT